ncbi:MAG: death-on-curing protein [Parcubacteria group bacterium]|nr:MAG: death-on-curing protein [Parcubacteria group bacterium]
MKKIIKKQLVVYQAKSGAIEFRGDWRKETFWATQEQIAHVFDVERSVITKHIRNILREKELKAGRVCAKFAHTATDGKIYQVQFYNLDLIIAVGYRINSVIGTKFRQWATKMLRQHITKGYTINPKSIKYNYAEFQKAIANIKYLLPPDAKLASADVLELISAFADTWLSLEAYDQGKLKVKGATKKSVALTADILSQALADFKAQLMKRGQASALFGQVRQHDAMEAIVGNIMQSFGGQNLYPTIEDKAAHLLYFIVKNHPLVDGNKRSGAYAFIWFLNKAKILNRSKLSPAALTALTLLVAESSPKDKDKMMGLILRLLKV